jgi:hypothetical protein
MSGKTLAHTALLLLLLSVPSLPAQTAAEMDALLETGAVSFGQAARFVLDAAGKLDPKAGSAYVQARQRGWLRKTAYEDRPLATGELSFLVMKAFDLKGSFLYRLFPGPRYAFRELAYLGLLPGRQDPALPVSGEELVRPLSLSGADLDPEAGDDSPDQGRQE